MSESKLSEYYNGSQVELRKPRRISPMLLAQVEAVLPRGGDGATAKEVGVMVGAWAHQTIKCALRALVNEGRARRVGTEMQPRFFKLGD